MIPEKQKKGSLPFIQKITVPETLSTAEEQFDFISVSRLNTQQIRPRDLKNITERLSRIEKKWKERKIGEPEHEIRR